MSAKSNEAKIEAGIESGPQSGAPTSSTSPKSGKSGTSGAVNPKEAETQERSPEDPLLVVQRALDENMAAAGIASALAPDESGFRQRVKDDKDGVTSESIDELIEGLPFEAALPRRKSARRRQEEEAERPKRAPLPSLTGQAPLITGTGDVAAALRDQKSRSMRSGSLVPAGLSKGRRPYIGGLALLGGLLVAAYFVARSTAQPTPATVQTVVTAQQAPTGASSAALARVPPPSEVPAAAAGSSASGENAQPAASAGGQDDAKGRTTAGTQPRKRVKNTRPGASGDTEMTLDDSSGIDSTPGERSQGAKKGTSSPNSAKPPQDTGMLSL